MLGYIIKKIFENKLFKKLMNDNKLKELLTQGDKSINNIKKNSIDLMIRGYEVPLHLTKYVNFNNLNTKEREYITSKIVEEITSGNCPHNDVIKMSYFDNTHPLWEKYLSLKTIKNKENQKKEREKKKQENKKITNLISKYGKDNYEKSLKGEVFLDMDEELLIISKGKPNKKDNNLVRGKKSEVWYYDEYENRLKNKSYKLTIRLIEGKVKGWKNL
jgi:hypothetical protein